MHTLRLMKLLIPPPAVVAIFALVMWPIARYVDVGRFSFALQTPLAALLLLLASILMGAAIRAFAVAKTTINPLKPSTASHLVTSGVFAWSRNPIYLGDLVLLAALALWLGHAAAFALLPLFVVYLNRFQIVPEEQALDTLFAHEYRAYTARVRRWL